MRLPAILRGSIVALAVVLVTAGCGSDSPTPEEQAQAAARGAIIQVVNDAGYRLYNQGHRSIKDSFRFDSPTRGQVYIERTGTDLSVIWTDFEQRADGTWVIGCIDRRSPTKEVVAFREDQVMAGIWTKAACPPEYHRPAASSAAG